MLPSRRAAWRALAVFDGEVIALEELRLETFADGFFFGCGLFETLAVDAAGPQFLERHLARMRRGLAALPTIEPPKDMTLLDTRALRPVLTRALAQSREATGTPPSVLKIATSDGHVLVTFGDASLERETQRRDGIDVETMLPAYRAGDPLCNHKTLSYIKQTSAIDTGGLFANERGEACESATANLFVVLADRIITPPLSAPCLPGVVREILLETGHVEGKSIVEEVVQPPAFALATGCFLTSSVSIAVPVRRLFGRSLAQSTAPAAEARALVARARAAET